MLYDRTDNQIKYNYYFTGPQGARFILFPVIGRNKPSQILAAKEQLHRESDVVKIYTEWIDEKEWRTMKLQLHVTVKENDFLNKKYHELYYQIYE